MDKFDDRDKSKCWIKIDGRIGSGVRVKHVGTETCDRDVFYEMLSTMPRGKLSYVCKEHGEYWESTATGWHINRETQYIIEGF